MDHQKRLEAIQSYPVLRVNVLEFDAIPYRPHCLMIVSQREKDVSTAWLKICPVRSGDGKDAVHNKGIPIALQRNGRLPNMDNFFPSRQGLGRDCAVVMHKLPAKSTEFVWGKRRHLIMHMNLVAICRSDRRRIACVTIGRLSDDNIRTRVFNTFATANGASGKLISETA